MVNKVKNWIDNNSITIYIALAILTAVLYSRMVALMNVQTAWINVVSGRVSVSILVALFVWVMVIDRLAKKYRWNSKLAWVMSLLGVLILLLVATSGGK